MSVANIEVELRVEVGGKVVTVRHEVNETIATVSIHTIVRELIRQTADAGARAFPNPQSPYSDDLFKAGQDKRAGIVDAPPRPVPPAADPYDLDD